MPVAICALLCVAALVHVVDETDAIRHRMGIGFDRLCAVIGAYRLSIAVEPKHRRDRATLPRLALSLSVSGLSATIGSRVVIDTRCPVWRRAATAAAHGQVAMAATLALCTIVWSLPLALMGCR